MKVVLAVVAMLGLVLVWVGCGDDGNQGSTGSQLDDEAAGASTSTVGGAGSTGGSVTDGSSQGNAMVDYPMDQCTSEMTKRYGDVETARKICSALQTDYSSSRRSQLATILPPVETVVGATPLPGSTIPGTEGQAGGDTGGNTDTNTGGGTGGNTNSGSGGWDGGGIEIVVPPAP
ncbi:MAG: hypothetical protein ACYC4D_03590 [Thermoleophilia bacterium]